MMDKGGEGLVKVSLAFKEGEEGGGVSLEIRVDGNEGGEGAEDVQREENGSYSGKGALKDKGEAS